MQRAAAFLVIAVVWTALWLILPRTLPQPDPPPGIDTPSPALGKAVATAIHQAVTDPYFVPLERLADYLNTHPDEQWLTVEQLASWTLDSQFPDCFVWEVETNHLDFRNPASPFALDAVVSRLREGLQKDNPRDLLYVNEFEADGQRYWLGFLKIPLREPYPVQMAGVFFSFDDYLGRDVPRLISSVVDRKRFPLVGFEQNDLKSAATDEGDISFRILDRNGNVYFQRGRNFDPARMIYAESQYYPNPIVCLQQGWDLQVFSRNANPPQDPNRGGTVRWVLLLTGLAVIALAFWWRIPHRSTTGGES